MSTAYYEDVVPRHSSSSPQVSDVGRFLLFEVAAFTADMLLGRLLPAQDEYATVPRKVELFHEPVQISLEGRLVPQISYVQSAIPGSISAVVSELNLVKSRLHLSMTQFADLFQVTRKTIYDWYDGSAPRESAAAKVRLLSEVLREYDGDLSRLKTVWKVPLSGASFIDTLNDGTLGPEKAHLALVEKLNELRTRLVPHTNKTLSRATFIEEGELPSEVEASD